ncbi:MAG: selenide, water dikinase SelD [Bacteroidales bacterium]|nr:selenide, water dikinase SelD [Bacteroidales bacterium]
MTFKPPIYLDYNATTPVDPEVIEAMEPFFREHFGNPSSSHYYGSVTRTAIEKARLQLAKLISAKPQEIVFTSGGTESNNMAIQGVAFANQHKGKHIITSSVEHPAVSEVCRYLEDFGFIITRVPVDGYGMINPEDVRQAIRKDTILISIMDANNEVGTIQPIKEIAAIARKHNIIIHTDCAQSLGKSSVSVEDLGVDLLSVAGHKLYAPKGVGALFLREGVRIKKIFHGADHEQNTRPGTENVLEIVGLGHACEIAQRDLEVNIQRMQSARDLLESELSDAFPEMRINGHPEHRLPNTLNVSFRNMEASSLLLAMDGVAASAGAACHADEVLISPVLQAMDIPVDWAMGTIRFSTGKNTSKDEIHKAVHEIILKAKQFMPDDEEESILEETDGEVKLTQFTHGLGCACKLRPQDLEQVLKSMPVPTGENILLGPENADDAAVYLINDDLAVVQTVDFFTPVVDDPYQFGAIAATNALSDIYAMGASPSFALNIVGFPAKRLPLSVLEQIMKGASDKATEAGIPILGGHTIEDNEPKFGMVVSGFIHPDKLWKNEGARPGDLIILTKPIGLGIMATALKRGLLDQDQINVISDLMTQLNKVPSELIRDLDIHACTDVTGFGLLGHLLEVVRASNVSVDLRADEVPQIQGASELIAAGVIPGGTKNNLSFVKADLNIHPDISDNMLLLLADAQTSGGLLIFSEPEQARIIEERFQANGLFAKVVGKVKAIEDKLINIL